MTLHDLPPGGVARVTGVLGEPLLRERLVELGFTPGTAVEVRGRAPLGGPLELGVRGGLLALRADEAACVEVANGDAPARAAAPHPAPLPIAG